MGDMSWQMWAVISAMAAGATSVFAKAGLDDVPSHLGNAVRTAIILMLSIGILVASGEHASVTKVSGKAWLMIALSAIATAVSWVAPFSPRLPAVSPSWRGLAERAFRINANDA
jgi:transporter family protein